MNDKYNPAALLVIRDLETLKILADPLRNQILEILAPENSFEIIRGQASIRSYDGMIWKYCGVAADGKTVRFRYSPAPL